MTFVGAPEKATLQSTCECCSCANGCSDRSPDQPADLSWCFGTFKEREITVALGQDRPQVAQDRPSGSHLHFQWGQIEPAEGIHDRRLPVCLPVPFLARWWPSWLVADQSPSIHPPSEYQSDNSSLQILRSWCGDLALDSVGQDLGNTQINAEKGVYSENRGPTVFCCPHMILNCSA